MYTVQIYDHAPHFPCHKPLHMLNGTMISFSLKKPEQTHLSAYHRPVQRRGEIAVHIHMLKLLTHNSVLRFLHRT